MKSKNVCINGFKALYPYIHIHVSIYLAIRVSYMHISIYTHIYVNVCTNGYKADSWKISLRLISRISFIGPACSNLWSKLAVENFRLSKILISKLSSQERAGPYLCRNSRVVDFFQNVWLLRVCVWMLSSRKEPGCIHIEILERWLLRMCIRGGEDP